MKTTLQLPHLPTDVAHAPTVAPSTELTRAGHMHTIGVVALLAVLLCSAAVMCAMALPIYGAIFNKHSVLNDTSYCQSICTYPFGG